MTKDQQRKKNSGDGAMNRRSIIASLMGMLLAPLGLRLLESVSKPVNGQVPCWDCGKVPPDERGRQTVALGFNCQACFDRDTGDLSHFLTLPAGVGWADDPKALWWHLL